MFPKSELIGELLEIDREIEGKLGIGYLDLLNGLWKGIDSSFSSFNKKSKSGKIEGAEEELRKLKESLNILYNFLEQVYEIESKYGCKRIEHRRRINNLEKAKGRIGEYRELLNRIEKGDLSKAGSIAYLGCAYAYTLLQLLEDTREKTINILNVSQNEIDYKKHINELKRSNISTLTRFVATLKLNEVFDSIELPNQRKIGIRGEFDTDQQGIKDISQALLQLILYNITLLDTPKEKAEKLKEELMKILPPEVGGFVTELIESKELLRDFYGLRGLPKFFLEANKMEIMIEERIPIIEKILYKSKCHVIPLFHIVDYLLGGKLFEVTDILIRFYSEEKGESKNLEKEIIKAKENYLQKYLPPITKALNSLTSLWEKMGDAKTKEKDLPPYHELLDLYESLQESITTMTRKIEGLQAFEVEEKTLGSVNQELRRTLKRIRNRIEEYREKKIVRDEVFSDFELLFSYLKSAFDKMSKIKVDVEKSLKDSQIVTYRV